MQRVAAEIDALVAEGRIPSASIVVRVEGELALLHTAGRARLEPERPAVLHQAYDLASVTKPLAGATVASELLRRGELSLDDRAARFVPEVDPRITVRMLLQHVSGYPPWAPLHDRVPRSAWGTAEARATILAEARRSPLAAEPGATHAYSDLGFLVLLQVLEAVGGPLDGQLDRILARAGLAGAVRWGWEGAAATEDCPLRGEVIEGRVHDPNAFAMGGVSTHAGLFGTAASVAAVAEGLLDAARGVRDDLPSPLPLWAAKGLGSHRAGWDGVSRGAYTSTGRGWPDDGVGHLGYTGCSLWIAPRARVVVAFFTNRIHPTDDKGPIRAARPRVHDAVARALGWIPLPGA